MVAVLSTWAGRFTAGGGLMTLCRAAIHRRARISAHDGSVRDNSKMVTPTAFIFRTNMQVPLSSLLKPCWLFGREAAGCNCQPYGLKWVRTPIPFPGNPAYKPDVQRAERAAGFSLLHRCHVSAKSQSCRKNAFRPSDESPFQLWSDTHVV